jgi:L-Lysine epsilon oxidase N-terminal
VPDQQAITQDFLLQNHDVFFVDTAKDMCEFTCQSLNGGFDAYVKAHPITGQILTDMEKVVDTVLGTSYWSGLPSRFGDRRYVKYKLEPESAPESDGKPNYGDPFYLRSDLISRMKRGEARFKFLVQFQTNDEEMPLDRATVRWSEKTSPPIHVATLILPRQDIETRGQSEYGENLAFTTWHALPEHEPAGSIAAARKVVYLASADVRRNFNATPLGEPTAPRPAEWKPGFPYPPVKDAHIVRAAIHPAIGIARVGNSPADFLIGPEVTDPAPEKPGTYRDATGALKRQAARFRIYGYNCAGGVVRELTADWADISWTVHVANRNAAWY